MVNYDTRIQNNIRGAGYGMQFIGLETAQLPLYLHKDSLSDKKLGDVFIKARIGNPATGPNNAELQYLARKATIGLFAWLPGEDCLVKKFENVEYVDDLIGGGTRIVRQEPYMGCQWCRDRASKTSQVHEAGVELTSVAEPVIEMVSAPPSAKSCPECGQGFKLKNKKGKLFSNKQHAAQLAAHNRNRHKIADTSGANPEVPTVRSVGVGEDIN